LLAQNKGLTAKDRYPWLDQSGLAALLAGSLLALITFFTSVTARKDDAPAADQAATTNVAGLASFSGGGGLIQTTSG
jgi:hypothetical protein